MLRKLSYTADMFKAPACLRARGEPEFSRLCPGMLSVLLGLLFSYVLLINLIELIEYKTISSMTIHEVPHDLYGLDIKKCVSAAFLKYLCFILAILVGL